MRRQVFVLRVVMIARRVIVGQIENDSLFSNGYSRDEENNNNKNTNDIKNTALHKYESSEKRERGHVRAVSRKVETKIEHENDVQRLRRVKFVSALVQLTVGRRRNSNRKAPGHVNKHSTPHPTSLHGRHLFVIVIVDIAVA